MKQLYIFLILVFSNFSLAQSSELFQNSWYLTNLNDNIASAVPPVNLEVPNIKLTFYPETNRLETNVCNVLMGFMNFTINDDPLFIVSNYGATLGICSITENASFENRYFTFFFENIENPFNYTITQTGDVKTLTITSLNNKQAVYSNVPLSTDHFDTSDFKMYPNPSTDFIIVELDNKANEDMNIIVYDSRGRVCKSMTTNSKEAKIETANLSSGIYFVNVTTGNKTITKKFIKS